MTDIWDPGIFEDAPIFDDLGTLFAPQQWQDWPAVSWLNSLLSDAPLTRSGRPVHFVDCEDAGSAGAAAYEKAIYASGAVPTRPRNWHDFFNALMWARFPATKAALNAVHVRELSLNDAGRSARRDAVTLLDECGVILPVTDRTLTRLHESHRWRALFCARRKAWGRRIAPMMIGHGLYEQCLRPYVGLTAKAFHLVVTETWFLQPLAVRYRQIDAMLAEAISSDSAILSTRELLPLPVLGVPGWWPGNRAAGFYENRDYFRPKRGTNC